MFSASWIVEPQCNWIAYGPTFFVVVVEVNKLRLFRGRGECYKSNKNDKVSKIMLMLAMEDV
jgi:hypothetical protein